MSEPATSWPAPPTFGPAWLSPESVKEWLRLHEQDTSDDALLTQVCAAAEPYVQRCRPEWLQDDERYVPDAETYEGAVMYAARAYRRRNSPAGVELLGDVTSFVARYDGDIDRRLRTGQFAPPALG